MNPDELAIGFKKAGFSANYKTATPKVNWKKVGHTICFLSIGLGCMSPFG